MDEDKVLSDPTTQPSQQEVALDITDRDVIVPAPVTQIQNERDDEPMEWDDAYFPLTWWVRGSLIAVVGIILSVLTVAVLLNPYEEDGTPKRAGTHRTPPLNLPKCGFYERTGKPCPSCGMTTSFSLLMHGDIVNSLLANWVGTCLALFCIALVPWSIVSIVRARTPFVQSITWAATVAVLVFMGLSLLRWGIVLIVSMF